MLIFQARENAPSGPKVDTSGPRKRGPLEKVARLRGLPFSAGQEELRTFFGNGKVRGDGRCYWHSLPLTVEGSVLIVFRVSSCVAPTCMANVGH